MHAGEENQPLLCPGVARALLLWTTERQLAEARALRWDDIDWRNNRIVTFRQKTESGFAIPLFHQLRPLLERRFASRNGREKVFSVKKAAKAIAGACKRLNLPSYTHICFR